MLINSIHESLMFTFIGITFTQHVPSRHTRQNMARDPATAIAVAQLNSTDQLKLLELIS